MTRRSAPVSETAVRLTWLLALLALVAALAGLLLDGVYEGAEATAEMFRAYDLVTTLALVPGLALTARAVKHGSVGARLVTLGLIAYLVYTYAYYLFGTGFNDLFLVHAAVFATGVAALVLTVVGTDVGAVASRFGARTRVRTVAGILGLLAVALGGMWVYFAIHNAVTGEVPGGSRLVETATVVRLGMALDLALLVPLYAVAAVLLWRRVPWGYVLAAVAVVAGILHQVSYMVALPFQVAAGVPGAVSFDPGEPVIVLAYVAAGALLVRGMVGHRAEGQSSSGRFTLRWNGRTYVRSGSWLAQGSRGHRS